MRDKAFWSVLLASATCFPAAAQEPEQQPRAPLPATVADAEAAINAAFEEIARLYGEGRYAEALEQAAAVAVRAEMEFGPDHPLTLISVNNLAVIFESQGRYAEAEPLFLRALAASERLLGAEHPDTLVSVTNLGNLYKSQGRYTEVEPLYLRALGANHQVLGSEHPETLRSVNNLAVLYDAQGRYAEAEVLYLRALEARERLLGSEHSDTLASVNNLAALYGLQGRYDEAEPLFRQALTANERVRGTEHPTTLFSVSNLGTLYELQDRYADAEPLYRRALAGRERVLGAEHPRTLDSVNNLAANYYSQGRYEQAEPLYHRALAARQRLLGADHPDTLVSVDSLAVLYDAQGRHAEAQPLYLRVLAANERVLGPEHPNTSLSLHNLGTLYQAQDRHAQAEPLLVRALAVRERVLGAGHPDTIATTQTLAITKLATSDPDAFRLAEAALSSMRKRARLADDSRVSRSANPVSQIGLAAFGYARAAWLAEERPPINDSFEALQLVEATSVGSALARSAALATLDRTSQALALERESVASGIDEIDSAFVSAAGTGGGTAALAELQAQRTALHNRLETIDAELEVSHPRYFELIRPQPIPLDALRKDGTKGPPLLRADEALILVTPGHPGFPEGHRRGFVFAVTREGAAWAELPLDPVALAELIAEVRDGSAIIDPRVQQPVPRKRAKALYDALFGAPEIARLIAGKPSWIVSPQGQLLSTPFAALVTRDPQGDDDDPEAWAGTAWLGAERALAILPEVHMLRALRGFDRAGGAASAPYFGLADPAFEGKGTGPETRSAASFFRGAVGSPNAIIKLTPLPNTRNEVETVARALGAGPDSLLTGREATEAALRVRAARLADSRVIHFATHALVAGEMGGLTQPALALMPPTGAAAVEESNDGLLTAAEAATLKLNADWVILSACNTAAGEDHAAEGLSGLARSFFYAGAASLLVSQWKVRDDSGAMLVAETVKAFAADESIGRAEALRRAIRTVSASRNARGESFAHPQDWAPFMLVGVDR